MAILKIARMGHPVLATPAVPVEDPAAPEIAHLLGDMIETLGDAGGVGLAAPQVHVSLRVVIFHIPHMHVVAERYQDAGLDDADGPVPLTVLINPVIEPLGDDTETAWESCLSLPGMTGSVARYTRIRYTGIDLEGELFERTAEGFHARVVQHECDHLDGILYPQRMSDLSQFGFAEEMRQRHSNGNGGNSEDEKEEI